MRFCGGFLRWEQVSCPKQGHKTHSAASESVRTALLANLVTKMLGLPRVPGSRFGRAQDLTVLGPVS